MEVLVFSEQFFRLFDSFLFSALLLAYFYYSIRDEEQVSLLSFMLILLTGLLALVTWSLIVVSLVYGGLNV
jgi:heme A synthase